MVDLFNKKKCEELMKENHELWEDLAKKRRIITEQNEMIDRLNAIILKNIKRY